MALPSIRACAAAAVFALAATAVVLPRPALALDEAARKEIEQVIREYLLANPELMLEVQEALEAKQKANRLAAQQKTLSDQSEAIYSATNQIAIGSPDAPITIVEFFDYNCGFCQRALSDMNRLVEDGNVRFVLKEFPILSQQSFDAHKISIAFARLMPDKAAEFHRQLLGAEGLKDGERALELAVSLGADREAIAAAAGEPVVLDTIRQNHKLAEDLGITGTPSYVVGDEVVFGAVGFDDLSTRVANVGQCGKATC
ncbi:MAG: membrane protein [Alphaproteobacteria bacterium]|nr:MAG: membrane protein [Alphaproteobacteria bacterium]